MGMSNPDKTLFPLMRASHIKWSESFRIPPPVFASWWLGSTKRWKTLFPKTSEGVIILKFKVHDAGSIGSLGCTVFELILLTAVLAIKTPFLAMDITPWVYDVLLLYLVRFSSTFFVCTNFEPKEVQGGTVSHWDPRSMKRQTLKQFFDMVAVGKVRKCQCKNGLRFFRFEKRQIKHW